MAKHPEAMDSATLTTAVQWLLAGRRAEAGRLNEIHAYLKNRVVDIYVPQSATAEYRKLVDQARFNVLPLLVSSVAQGLFVDGYRPARQSKNSPVWDAVWQPNRMDARQAGLYRASLGYGVSYATVLPGMLGGKKTPVITPWSPRRMTALYADPIHDEWPRYAISVGIPRPKIETNAPEMVTEITVYDDQHTYTAEVPASVVTPEASGQRTDPLPFEGLALDTRTVLVRRHGLGVCPVVRYLESYDDLDDGPQGIVYPMLPAQRQLNQATFSLLMTQQVAAFRQRWVTGMAIAEDDDGNPVEPWNAAVNRVWQSDSPDTKFGDFAESNLSGYLDSRDKTLLYVSSVRQIPPHKLVIGNSVSNVSAEALAALNDGHQLDIGEHKVSFGESHEQLLRLAGLAMGDMATWEDQSAQVVWRDTTPRSLAQVADALGKIATQLGVPARALWEKIPGTTDQDISRWLEMADDQDVMKRLGEMLADDGPAGAPAEEVPDGGIGGRSGGGGGVDEPVAG
ncbi:phage portal protein [Streptomyces corynorhini]|uniref:Phage portal protein n=1 Tax=Streptomyces corynorhini TaxID=2282652 RepID=A0A370BCM5_9ACTN|nr:phage portal protein [Streptomyces corynorhini]RDG37954.1 phage portal protein [Streptomyces corynorhini]